LEQGLMGSSNNVPNMVQSTKSDAPKDLKQRQGHGFVFRIKSIFGVRSDAAQSKSSSEHTIKDLRAETSHTHGMANLRRLRVDDVALPKVNVVAVSMDIGKDELVEVFRKEGFSRMPVYKGTLDLPQGLILLKDLALQHGFGAGGRFSLRKLIRPILYAPPSMPIGILLQKMQKERVHMALVIDEYGGVDGLVTIVDLIETVIGEIEDEHDEDEGSLWKEEKQGVFLAMSNAPLDEFELAIGLTLRNQEDDKDIDTVGGLVFVRTGHVPARGEIVPHESGAEFEVVDADARSIKRLRLRLPEIVRARDGVKQRTADL
jgi:magnesium and cobalt transporter